MKKILVFFFLIPCISLAQNSEQKQIDSLLNTLKSVRDPLKKCIIYNEISGLYYNIDVEKGEAFADKSLALSSEIKYSRGLGIASSYKGEYLFRKGQSQESLKWYAKAKKLLSGQNDNCAMALLYLKIGNSYGATGKYPEALDHFFKALQLYDGCAEDSIGGKASVYQSISNIYTATENYQKALKSYDLTIRYYKQIHSEGDVAMALASKGMVYSKMKKNPEALSAYNDAIKKLIPLHAAWEIAYIESWIAITYFNMGQYNRSLEIMTEKLKTMQEMGDQDLVATLYQNIGYCYLQKAISGHGNENLAKSYENLNKALEMHRSFNSHEGLIQDYKFLSEYFDFKKEFRKSLYAYQQYATYKDSVFNFKNKQSLQNLEYERALLLREKEIKINKLKLESREKQKWLLITGILFLFIIGSLFFYQSLKRKKMNSQLIRLNTELDLANKIKARFFSILNHDLRSPVSNLIHFLHLKKENPELLTDESRNAMENKTINAAENLLESMEDLLIWSKGQMTNFKPQPKNISAESLFDYLKNHFSGEEKVSLNFENPNNIQFFSDEDYLKTIMRNLTGNAIHSLTNQPDGQVIWKARMQNGKAQLSITDNGPGGSSEQFRALYDENEVTGIRAGLGLHLIRDFAKSIDFSINIESGPSGTTFILTQA